MTDTLWLYVLAVAFAGALAAVVWPLVPVALARWEQMSDRMSQAKVEKATRALDDMFIDVQASRLKRIYRLAPLAIGFLAFALFKNLLLVLLGAAVGIVLPDLWVRSARSARNNKFRGQLVDALFILSSSLKAGLSLIQALEVVEEEMPPPISQEFGLMIKAHRLGRTFEESLQTLNERMPSEETSLITTALLVGRETGGDVTTIIAQLVTTIREKKKLLDKTNTLTLQGRLQAYIMSALPVGFAVLINTFNPEFFNPLTGTALGRSLMVLAVILWLGGMIILMKLSKVEI